ncbi:MAG TPA: TadE/TadG family type IV pilus assembly protein [Gaiellales bacterium]|nr:TadE/TadG family type IV pilus assembly protein [Gaiellales bacterium]
MSRRILRNQQGQAVTEFAVILPVLLLVLLAIYQFGVVFNNYIQVTAAAREGARKAAVSRSAGSCASVQTMAINAAKSAAPGLDQSKIGVTVSATCTNNQYAAGSDTKVTVTYPYSVSILGKVVASGNLSSSTTMREE